MTSAAVPFVIRREHGVVRLREITATREVSHGLLRLAGNAILAQWTTDRETSRVGREIRVDHELGPVEEVQLPLDGLAGARVRWRLLPWPPRWQLVLRAADLRAFERLAGAARLPLTHPAELVLDLRQRDRAVAREFALDLSLALADEAVRLAERESRPALRPASAALPVATPRLG